MSFSPWQARVGTRALMSSIVACCILGQPLRSGAQADPEAVPGATEAGQTAATDGEHDPDLPPVPQPPVHEPQLAVEGAPFIDTGRPPDRQIATCWDSRDGPRSPEQHRCAPETLELVELYVFAATYGVTVAVALADELDAADGAALFGLVSAFGVGAIVGAWALTETDSMLPGMPAAISTGILVGWIESMLLYGAFVGRPYEDGSGAEMLAVGTGLTAIGVGVSYLLKPTIAESSIVRSGILWGTYFGGMVNLLRDDSDEDRRRVTAIAGNVGLVLGLALSQLLELRRSQVLAVDAGGFAGFLIGGTAAAASDADRQTRGWLLSLPTLAGMIAGVVFAAVTTGEAEEIDPHPVSPMASVVPGGGVIGVRRVF